jgi:hypothetical protein
MQWAPTSRKSGSNAPYRPINLKYAGGGMMWAKPPPSDLPLCSYRAA